MDVAGDRDSRAGDREGRGSLVLDLAGEAGDVVGGGGRDVVLRPDDGVGGGVEAELVAVGRQIETRPTGRREDQWLGGGGRERFVAVDIQRGGRARLKGVEQIG